MTMVALTVSFNFSGITKVNAATYVLVDPAKQYQTLEGWGTSLAWWGNAVGSWQDLNKKTQVSDLLFDETNGLGLNIVRYNIGGGENPSHEHMRVKAEIPSYQPEAGVWDWNADAAQRWVLQSSIDRGANILEAFTNAPPYWMTYSKCAAGSTTGLSNNLYDDAYDEFAEYITEVVKHFKNTWGITFRTVAPLNEPNSTWWRSGNNQEGCHFDRDKQDLLLREVASRLHEKGLTATSVSAPEEYNLDDSITSFNSYGSTTKNYITQINTHTYKGSNRTGLRDTANTNNKKLWVSEVGIGGSQSHNHQDMSSAIQLANQIRTDVRDMQVDGWVYWQAVEDEAGNNNYGFIHANFAGTEDYWVTKQYYGMANYSKFIRPGAKIIDIGSSESLAAYDPNTNKVVIVTTNSGSGNVDYTYDLAKFASVGQSSKVYRTSSTENLAQLADVQITNKAFTATAVANSITTFVIENVSYNGWNQINDTAVGVENEKFNYTGTWDFYGSQSGAYYNDNHYSAITNNYYTLTFFGTQAKIYAAKANNHGIAGISIDGGAETNVDLYSSARLDQALVYTTPVLSPGKHTIKVRVTGIKNGSSSGTCIIADRIDVINDSTVNESPVVPTDSEPKNDIAIGKTTTADSVQSGNDAKNANDGSLATRWCANNGDLNHWWQVDLGATRNILGSQITFGLAAKYIITGSADGTNWTTLVNKSNSSDYSQVQTDNYIANNVRYIRVTITGLQSGAWASIDEFKVYGTPSFVTVNDNTTEPSTNHYEYYGNWSFEWYETNAFLKDNHYSSNNGDYYLVKFNGTQAMIFAALNNNHGIAAISIDGGTETNVDLYSTSRVDNSLVYTSPILPAGEHTIKVRVTGTKNASSSGYAITADKANVFDN